MNRQKPLIVRWSMRFAGALVCASALSVCSDQGPSDDPPVSELPTDPQVSNPIEVTAASGIRASILNAEGDDNRVFVSLPAGRVPGGVRATVRRVGSEAAVITTVRDGGFDPVSIQGGPTDSVEIVVKKLDGTEVSIKAPINAKRPPNVVRSWPPRGKSNTPVNSSLVVVFSEPLDQTTITTSSIRVVSSGRTVAGQVRVLDGDGTTIAFKPDATLEPNSEYRLVVNGTVADLEGDVLGEQVVLGYSTGTTSLGPPASVQVSPDSIVLIGGTTYQLSAKAFDAAGNLLVDNPITWSSQEPNVATVSSTGVVTALPLESDSWQGTYIFATVGGIQGFANVDVVPPPVTLEIIPPSATLGIGDTLALEIVARTTQGSRTLPALSWVNSTPAVASIEIAQFDKLRTNPYRTARAIASGVTTFTVRAGGLSATTEITVVTQLPVSTVRVAPAALDILVGESRTLTAWLRDAKGADIQGTRPIMWSSSDPAVVSISTSGSISGHVNGTVTITASSEGKTSTATITVTPDAAAPTFANISAASGQTCAVTTTADAYCWGGGPNSSGGTNRPKLVSGGRDYVAVSTAGLGGIQPTCARTTANHLYCGMVGALPARFAPTIDFADFSVGGHSCGINTSGVAFCWGNNFAGQIGDGTTASGSSPKQVAGGLTFTSISVGGSYTCGVTTGGEGYCWGSGDLGKLGIGDNPPSSVPTPTIVSGSHTFSQISAGNVHTCGITLQGSAYCWGINSSGQLGDGTQTASTVPVAVAGGLTFTAIDVGSGYTCAIATGGAAYCWGSVGVGQLGVDAAEQCGTAGACSRQPIAVQGSLSFVRITAGQFHTCGLTPAGRMYCWGGNINGELGDATNSNRSNPTAVARPTP